MPDPRPDVVIVGAGLAGLVAATALVDRGALVVLLDKGRGPGGRLATRWQHLDDGSADAADDTARWDHGAQFFTVRSPEFERLISSWPITVWHHGPDRSSSVHDDPSTRRVGGDGHPRYVGTAGMNGIAKHLATGLDVRTDVHVDRIAPHQERWLIQAGDRRWDADRVLVTSPVPQTLALLEGVDVPPDVAGLVYDPCLALLAVLDGPPITSAVQFDGGPIHYLADNRSKGISDVVALTIHAGGEWSADHYDDNDEAVRAALTGFASAWFAGAEVRSSQVKRWRYAAPASTHEERAVGLAPGLVLAGDIFGEAKIEGAARSGLAAAELLA